MSAAPRTIAPAAAGRASLRDLAHRIEAARSAIRSLSPHEASQLPAFEVAENAPLVDLKQTEAHGLRLAQWFEARAAELQVEASAAREMPKSLEELNDRNERAEL